MNFKEIKELPNDGYKIASSLCGVINKNIIVGGGYGYIKPLSEGGEMILSSKIRLLTENNGEWILHDEVEVKHEGQKIGFCKGASFVLGDKLYYLAGITSDDNETICSSSVIEVSINNNKISYKFLKDILPFSGEVLGTKYNDDIFLICRNKNFLIKINNSNFDIIENFLNFTGNISGSLPISPKRDVLYLIGGYVPYVGDVPDSNYFIDNRIIIFKNGQIKEIQLKNIENNPVVFLGSSIIAVDYENILIIGGVNKKIFLEDQFNLATLRGKKLEIFKRKYFNKSEKEFKYNNKLLWINLNSLNVLPLFEFNNGYSSNPRFVNIDSNFYIIDGEIKPGIHLSKPIKFEFK